MRAALAIVLGSLAACSGNVPPADGDAMTCVEVRKDIPIEVSRDLDLLLVVDTSPSMDGEAARLAENLRRFGNVLENFEGGLPNMHVGVVSADVAARGGRLESTPQLPGCAAPDGAFLVDIAYANGEREANYTGSFTDALACIAALPATGGDIEEPLEAMKRALDGSNPENAGFVRDNAYLMVLFVGDEDDCSGGQGFASGEPEERSAWRCFDDGVQCDQDTATAGVKTGCAAAASPATLRPIEEYRDFLRGVKEDPVQVVVATVTGADGDPAVSTSADGPVLAPSCTADTAEAYPAVRMRDFSSRFPQRNSSTSACNDDWSEVLVLLVPVTTVIGSPCLEGEIDLDPDTDGIQHDCQVSELHEAGTPDETETLLDECSSADPPDTERPCWRIETSPLECPDTPTGATLEIERGRETVPPGTVVRARCFAGC